MGYKRMEKEDLYEIHRRWRAQHSISRIAGALGLDRKTVRQYIQRFLEVGLEQDGPEAAKKVLYELLAQILPSTERSKPAWQELSRFEQEIRELVQDKKEPVKPKTAYLILRRKHSLKASYESFKGFVRARGLHARPRKPVYVIELPAAKETQVDYGKVGLLEDRITGKNRVVWGFCTVLSHSRFPFIEFVYTQKKESFVESIIDSLEFYEGCTDFYSIDNLKSGVIKPDLWDPKLNRSLAEMAEYYGVFIDPCRVGRSTDKGKIERLIPVARELFRMLKHLHPGAPLNELNRYARQWCREEYGRREHGTTKIPPLEAFESTEKPLLKPLPAERFEVPVWQELSVHGGDGFFTFDGKRFAVPTRRGKTVWARYTHRNRLLQVFHDRTLLREYVVGSSRVNYLPGDFPEVQEQMMRGSYPRFLLDKAVEFGPDAAALIESVLKPHAYLNARRAQGMLEVMKQFRRMPFFIAVCKEALRRGVKLPSTFRAMLNDEKNQIHFDFILPVSEAGKQMIRDIEYYIN
jgi:transposase